MNTSIPATRMLILASSSPRRQELIRILNLPHEIIVSDADESIEQPMQPAAIVETLALRKADTVRKKAAALGKNGIIIGCDTIVVLDGEVLGKPKDEAEAAGMLKRLQGRTHQVFSGVACLSTDDGSRQIRHRETLVRMRPLSDAQIQRYIASGEPMDKAGSYGIQGLGAMIVERIEGDYFNVVGLPLSLLADMLGTFGISVL